MTSSQAMRWRHLRHVRHGDVILGIVTYVFVVQK